MINLPIQRVAIVALAIGVVLVAASLFYAHEWHRDLLEVWWESLWPGERNYRLYPALRWGTWLAMVGLLFSVGYRYTIGPLLRWIRYGKASRPL